MKKFYIYITIIVLTVFVTFIFCKYYFSEKNFQYNDKKYKLNKKLENDCIKLLNNDISTEENRHESDKITPQKDMCIEIFNYGNTFTISFISSYYSKKSENLLNTYINKIEQNFIDDKIFVNKIKEKNKELNKVAKDIIKKEFPDYFEKDIGSNIYIYNRQAALNYAKIDVLKGMVANYCLSNNFEEKCYIKIFDRIENK